MPDPAPTPAPDAHALAAAVRNWPADVPLAAFAAFGSTSLLARPLPPTPSPLLPPAAPTHHLGYLSYDLARTLEPAAQSTGARDDRAWPDALWLPCPALHALDHASATWRTLGDPAHALPPLDALLAPPSPARGYTAPPPDPAPNRAAYIAGVRRCLDLIRAGDVYQVNLAHRLSTPFSGSARALFADLLLAARPRHGAYLEFDDPATGTRRAVLSISPELFLDYDAPSRRVVTRPMKGTRPIAADPRELLGAPKDHAELAMIVDLMRNDLGRCCAFGSVRVDSPREVEAHHRSVLQATATVSGTLRDGLAFADLIAGAFPPGSVTGAPKIRAMQIIDELEPARRGPYCGSIGVLRPDGSAALNVAIRTALLTGPTPTPSHSPTSSVPLDHFDAAVLDYTVGAGIVADSDPDQEWQETLTKADILFRVLRGFRAKPVDTRTPIPARAAS